jgi:NAD(P)-dependent dehydrogenase (short-subunit alcohol dehydrogenase family)
MKTAVVTGASYGIGHYITEALLADGYKVYGLSRSRPPLDNERFVWLPCDLSKHTDIAPCIKQIQEPIIDVLVSNAGVVLSEAASNVSLEAFEKTYSVNVVAPMLLIAALRSKIAHATIISVSSVSDRLPDRDIALYCSSKAANTSYFNSLALDLTDARIYSLLPDFVDTPMLRKDFENDVEFKWDTIIRPEDIGKLTRDLIADRYKLESGTNIIIVTNALKSSFQSVEKLYGFNAETNELTKLA